MKRHVTKRLTIVFLSLLVAAPALVCATGASTNNDQFTVVKVASTVPPNGDMNPYGVAVVERTTGNLIAGHILVSNFNNSANLQGTGTTIMDIAPNGTVNVFASIDASTLPGQCPGGVGLTTALAVLRAGWVIVGSLPTTDGTAATAQAGCLLVLNNQGAVVETISDVLINGPWDMTVLDQDAAANLFVTNVLNGTVAANGGIVQAGTVVRIDLTQSPTVMPAVQSMIVIGSGFAERTDPSALVIGPTGVGLGPDATLYVADTLNNRIVSIPDAVNRLSSAQNGTTLSDVSALSGPLGLTVRQNNGEILSVNGDNGMLVVLRADGQMETSGFLSKSGTPAGAGALFGLATASAGVYYVDDATNTLNLAAFPLM
jgi:hypothetical protein